MFSIIVKIASFNLLLAVFCTWSTQKTKSNILLFVTKCVFPRIWSKLLVADAEKTPNTCVSQHTVYWQKELPHTHTHHYTYIVISLVFLQTATQTAVLALSHIPIFYYFISCFYVFYVYMGSRFYISLLDVLCYVLVFDWMK